LPAIAVAHAGSLFVSLPRVEAAASPESQVPAPLRVLVIDDDKNIRVTLGV